MTIDAQPRRLTPQQAFLNALADVQDAVERHHQLAEQLHKILEPQQEPGRLVPVKLNSARPYSTDGAQHSARSFTILNPTGMAVALGSGGIGASNVAAIVVPPTSAITLPLSADDLEIGPADPADLQSGGIVGANVDVYVFALLYRHVQPFYFGAWSG